MFDVSSCFCLCKRSVKVFETPLKKSSKQPTNQKKQTKHKKQGITKIFQPASIPVKSSTNHFSTFESKRTNLGVTGWIFRRKLPTKKKNDKKKHSWWFKVTFLGWLSDPFKWLSDLQLGDEKVTLNHLVKNHGISSHWSLEIPRNPASNTESNHFKPLFFGGSNVILRVRGGIFT